MVHLMIINRIVPGKIEEAKKIYANSVRMWKKHGARVNGIWDTWIGGDAFEVITMIEFNDFAEYEEIDKKIHADPEWRGAMMSGGVSVSSGRSTRLLRPVPH